MNKKLIALSILAISLSMFGCSEVIKFPGFIRSPHKTIIKGQNNNVTIDGRWKLKSGKVYRSFHLPPEINTTHITCDKQTGYCRELISGILMADDSILFVNERTYKIISWSKDVIQATSEEYVADYGLTISVKDSFAERSFRETKKHGSSTSDPSNYADWELE